MTSSASTPYASADQPVWDLLPPVAPYDPIAPTSVSIARQSVRSIEVTSSLIDAVVKLASSAGVGWLAAVRDVSRGQLGAAVAAGALTISMHTDSLRRTGADQICELRDEIQRRGGLSRSEIAQLIGVDRRSLSGWASGETSPSAVNLERLRTLAKVVRRLDQLGVPELAVSMRDAETAGIVTGAIRTGNADRAVVGVLSPADEEAPEVPALTREQWTALLRLANAAETAAVGPDQVADDQPEAPLHQPPLRVQFERAAYATPRRRPRRETRGE